MKIELVYFGRPREHLKISRETADVPAYMGAGAGRQPRALRD